MFKVLYQFGGVQHVETCANRQTAFNVFATLRALQDAGMGYTGVMFKVESK